ncbi:hypothetical protein PLICRDRAFT_171551 [Plicaturopsis crispa FD-325 SS-3]|nr:hypothetical protein PLICRDRAFT_171551 [Plicaturopsis crispa FD-325 SS-3]
MTRTLTFADGRTTTSGSNRDAPCMDNTSLTPEARQQLLEILPSGTGQQIVPAALPQAAEPTTALVASLDPEIVKSSRQARLAVDLQDLRIQKRVYSGSDSPEDGDVDTDDNQSRRNLSGKQLEVRAELQKLLKLELEKITGCDKNGNLLPQEMDSAANDGEDSNASDGEDESAGPRRLTKLKLDFAEQIDWLHNAKAITRATDLVWADQNVSNCRDESTNALLRINNRI